MCPRLCSHRMGAPASAGPTAQLAPEGEPWGERRWCQGRGSSVRAALEGAWAWLPGSRQGRGGCRRGGSGGNWGLGVEGASCCRAGGRCGRVRREEGGGRWAQEERGVRCALGQIRGSPWGWW